jgi:anthranilate/para-aminobenzoate synthase component I
MFVCGQYIEEMMNQISDGGNYQQTQKIKVPEPTAIIQWLRENQILTTPYYLHINQGNAEIGWQAKEHVSFLDGQTTVADDWVSAIKRIGDQAAAANSKAFGYLGFDICCNSSQGYAPDNSATFPLVQFFIPEHRICIGAGKIEYHGPDTSLLENILHSHASSLHVQLSPSFPDSGFSEHKFMEIVAAATQSMSDDTIVKVVLSRYLGFDYDADLLELFNGYCLRQQYADAILMDFGSVGAAIATPELLIHIDSGMITANPLAGTRALGRDAAENTKLAQQLLCDRKELAEHTLALLQMMRELQSCCEPGTLVVKKLLDIIQRNNIMHLSSELGGQLSADKHCIDAMLSLFPSAMVSGVPKSESIQLLHDLENFPRGLFAGTVGWVSGRNCRFALTIRGIYKYGTRIFVQAGAGVMAESDPAQENEEVRMKMSNMLATLSGNASNPSPHIE